MEVEVVRETEVASEEEEALDLLETLSQDLRIEEAESLKTGQSAAIALKDDLETKW